MNQQTINQAATEIQEQIDLDSTTANEKLIGKHLLEAIKTKEGLAEAFLENNCRLNRIWGEVVEAAKKSLKYVSGAVEDSVVYGWAENAVMNYKTAEAHNPEHLETPAETIGVTEEKKNDGEPKSAEPKQEQAPSEPKKAKKAKKEKPKPEHGFEQMRLW